MESAVENNMLKILCLHGYRQNGDIFKQKLGAMRKALKKYAEFTFVTAPNKIPPAPVENSSNSTEEADTNEQEQYGWWFSTEEMTFDSKKPSDVSIGFEKSLNLVEKVFEEQGPFDGVFGFSQGAAFVGILCGMQEMNMIKYEFDFAILVAGFKSLCHPHLNFYFKQPSIPSLHVYGESDQVIPKEMSELLVKQFEDSEIIVHPGGHFVPASGPQKQGYVSFLQQRKKEREDEKKRKERQIQVGSYVLERVEDSGSEEISDAGAENEDSSDSTENKTKANKGGITKQSRRKKLENTASENEEKKK